MNIVKMLLNASEQLSAELQKIEYPPNVFVYNVFSYAWESWSSYVQSYFTGTKSNLICGINPGPHGMVQTGIPFGAVSQVKAYLNIHKGVNKPEEQHTKRPIMGFSHHIEEKSGDRFWSAVSNIYPKAKDFFQNFAVMNFCPLAFLDANGKNLTPDFLPRATLISLEALCVKHLNTYISSLKVKSILCIGRYAEKIVLKLRKENKEMAGIKVLYISHPSPLNPKNKEFDTMIRPILKAYSINTE